MSNNIIKINPGPKAEASTSPFFSKEKTPSYGIVNPLMVKWESNQVIGDYLSVVVVNPKTKTVTDFVISRHIGPHLSIPREAMVINRRKDVPELIQNAPDPLKKRWDEISKKLTLEMLIEKKLVRQVGEEYLLTEQVSKTLCGQPWNKYTDRSKAVFDADKEAAKKSFDEVEGAKPFRQRKKFVYTKVLDDFLTKDEKAAKACIQTHLLDPEFRKRVDDATKTTHQTLVHGELNQPLLHLDRPGWEDLSFVGLTDEVSRTIFSVLTGKYQAVKPEVQLVEARAEIQRLKKALEDQEKKVQGIHDYYKSGNSALTEVEAKLVEALRAVDDYRKGEEEHLETIAHLEHELQEWKAHVGEEEGL